MREQLKPAQAQQRILDFAQKELGARAWIIVQSFTAIKFVEWSGAFPLQFDEIFTGRIFGKQGEIRWNLEDDMVDIWTATAAAEIGMRKNESRYYLWGTHRAQDQTIKEDLVGDLRYPPLGILKEADRPYILVVEYLAKEPPENCSVKELTDALNQPRVIGHRFKHFDAGID